MSPHVQSNALPTVEKSEIPPLPTKIRRGWSELSLDSMNSADVQCGREMYEKTAWKYKSPTKIVKPILKNGQDHRDGSIKTVTFGDLTQIAVREFPYWGIPAEEYDDGKGEVIDENMFVEHRCWPCCYWKVSVHSPVLDLDWYLSITCGSPRLTFNINMGNLQRFLSIAGGPLSPRSSLFNCIWLKDLSRAPPSPSKSLSFGIPPTQLEDHPHQHVANVEAQVPTVVANCPREANPTAVGKSKATTRVASIMVPGIICGLPTKRDKQKRSIAGGKSQSVQKVLRSIAHFLIGSHQVGRW